MLCHGQFLHDVVQVLTQVLLFLFQRLLPIGFAVVGRVQPRQDLLLHCTLFLQSFALLPDQNPQPVQLFLVLGAFFQLPCVSVQLLTQPRDLHTQTLLLSQGHLLHLDPLCLLFRYQFRFRELALNYLEQRVFLDTSESVQQG